MTLVKATLKAEIKALQAELATYDGSPGKTSVEAAERFADGLATAVDNFVKSATVATTVTVTSVTGVTAGPGVSGPGAGTGTGTLS